MTSTIKNVRDLLDGPAATSVPEDTIDANITRSKNIIDNIKQTGATTVQTDDAVTAMATWLTYGSYMEGITQMLGAISIADQVKLDHLRRVAEAFINQIAKTPIDLDADVSQMKPVGMDLSVFTQTTTEAFHQ